jgi:hypothetical protein
LRTTCPIVFASGVQEAAACAVRLEAGAVLAAHESSMSRGNRLDGCVIPKAQAAEARVEANQPYTGRPSVIF